jgi:hypothetical protein
MTVDSSFEWARNLRDSVLPTGNRTIDSLFATFNLVRTTAYDFYNGISVWARTETGANMRALANVLEKIPGVLESDPSGFAGGGGDIVQEIGDNLVYLTCSYGWDDCPSGCIEKRFWRFSIFPDCSVRFDSSYGNLLPKEKVYEVQEEGPLFYPNPATDKITIRSKVYNDIVISDIEGKTIRTFKSQQELTEVPVAGLPAGTYFISVREHSGEFTSAKFIKQ